MRGGLSLSLLALASRALANFDFTDAPFDRCATSYGLSLDDSLYAFVLSEDSTLWQKRQERGGASPWSNWLLIGAGNRFAGKPAVVRGMDGRLRMFVRGIDHAVYYSSQLEPNGELWDGWTCFGGQFAGGPVATVNAQGFVEVFAVGRDSALYTMAQTLNGTDAVWSEWSWLGGNLTGPPSTLTDAEGMVHVFARGDDRSLMHIRQVADLPYAFVKGEDGAESSQREWLHRGVGFELRWSEWQSLGGVLASGPVATVALNMFGMLEVYARFADKAIWRIGLEGHFENCYVGWGQWHMVGGLVVGPPAVATSIDGVSVVYARQADKQLYYKTQILGFNGTRFEPEWKLMHGAFAAGPSLIQKSSGLFEVLMQGVDRQIYHAAQFDQGNFNIGFGSFNSLGGRTRQFAC